MFVIIGIVLVLVAVVVGYTMHGGNIGVLIQINEFVVLGGAAAGQTDSTSIWIVNFGKMGGVAGPGPDPLCLGHEMSGTVEWVGPDVTSVRVGDRVAAARRDPAPPA